MPGWLPIGRGRESHSVPGTKSGPAPRGKLGDAVKQGFPVPNQATEVP